MKRFAVVAVLLSLVAVPSFCKTHSDTYAMSCSALWPAVKDAIRNSGKYGILAIDNAEMTASFMIGGTLGGKRINSVVLTGKVAGLLITTTAISRSAWTRRWPS